jgi:MFS-type transporter involved in bile tolerance (Atg22 family)
MSNSHEQPHLHEDNEDPDGWSLWAIGIGSTFLVIATVAISTGIYYQAEASEGLVKHINVRYEQRDMVLAAQQAVLEEAARWVSNENPSAADNVNRLVIPIDQAMDIVAGNN